MAMNYTGTSGDDDLVGTSGNDAFNMTQGGNDKVHAGDGNDVMSFGATYDSGDFVDGGTGIDTLKLDGDYATFFIAPTMMQNVERIGLAAGHQYNLGLLDGVVGNGQTLTVDGSALLAGDYLSIDLSSMTALSVNTTVTVNSGAGTNYFEAGPGANILHGGIGNDNVFFAGQFNATDRIDGGSGVDNSLTLDGDYSAGLAITSVMMTNFQYLNIDGGYSYKLTTSDANVAAGQVLHVIETGMDATDSLTFNGGHETDGSFYLSDGLGNDVLSGGAQGDTFAAYGGGVDKLYGNGGDDQFLLGGTLTATDHVDGGAGSDELDLGGDYSAGLTFGAATLANVETLFLYAAHSYKLTTNDANVAAGQTLTVNAQQLGAGDSLIFNGSHETDGQLYFYDGAGNDVLSGGAQADHLSGYSGGVDKLYGNDGDDRFQMGNALTAADHIDGGAGNDELDLSGDYAAGMTFKAATMVNIESLFLNNGSSYRLVMDDGNVAAGKSLSILGDLLTQSNTLIVNASAETDGRYTLDGGAGDDVLIGGQAGNNFFGHLGSDKMTAGSGADRFTYSNVADSTGVTRDVVTGFNGLHDKFDLPSGYSVNAIDAAVTSGTLSSGLFDTNLATAVDAAHLAAHDAVLFTPDAGTLHGHTFLVVDMNGVAGYQAGVDLVIQLESATHLDSLATTSFI